MNTYEKVNRLLHPKVAADWGLSATLEELKHHPEGAPIAADIEAQVEARTYGAGSGSVPPEPLEALGQQSRKTIDQIALNILKGAK